jgi:hypothetical protein
VTVGRLELRNDDVELVANLDRGGDIVSLVDRRTGVDVMFRTPWAARAEEVARRGSLVWHDSSVGAWLESYAGGWQLLCPNVHEPVVRDGRTHGFHGEAAVVPWTLESATRNEARLHVELHTVPLRIERTLSLAGATVVVDDVVRNLAPVEIGFDYQHHPAFGRPLLAPGCVIETGARTFVADPGSTNWRFPAGSTHSWPPAVPGGAEPRFDLVPPADRPRAALGWLADFDEPWAAIRNPELDLGVALRWDTSVMPYAWLWQELEWTEGYPWYGRAYAMAIEPSSTVTGGPGRLETLRLAGYASLRTGVRLTLCGGRQPIRRVDAAGSVTV